MFLNKYSLTLGYKGDCRKILLPSMHGNQVLPLLFMKLLIDNASQASFTPIHQIAAIQVLLHKVQDGFGLVGFGEQTKLVGKWTITFVEL